MFSHDEKRIGYFNLINKSTSLMLQILSEHSLSKNPPDTLINMQRNKFGTFDFDKAAEIIDYGESVTNEVLKNSDH